MKQAVQIESLMVPPGTKGQGRLRVGELAIGSDVALPVMVINGREEGPTLWINGAVHGDELNGPMAARNVFSRLDPGTLRGALVITPISNVLAFQARDKISHLDYLDLNTLFPGDSKGLFTQRIAFALFQHIAGLADSLIDLHTLATPYKADPYTVYKIVPGAQGTLNEKMEEMAFAFGVRVNCRVELSNATGELPGTTHGALDIECIKRGIPAIMAEVGGGGRFEGSFIAAAEQGIENVLVFLGMIPGTVKRPQEQIVITKRRFVRTDLGGLVKVFVEPGQIIERGKAYAEVFDFFGRSVQQTAERDLFVIASRVSPVVDTGDRLLFAGIEWSTR